jgi:aerobic-type carbon monoxide dehydrogenase small subunit (CoxS/CutS family)
MSENISFKLNGKPVSLTVESGRMLLWVLRTDLGLTGTKFGCGAGLCGACAVLVDNEAVHSCQFPVQYVRGKEVTTIEGLEKNRELHPLQQAFIEHDALQCGFCTPGMIISAYSLLLKNPEPSTSEITQHMDQNLCRCGSYTRVIQAIQTASKRMQGVK